MILVFATHPEITLLGDYIFRTCISDDYQGKALADFAIKDLKAETAVILTCIDQKYSLELSKIFTTHFRKNGGRLLWEGEYFSSATDFRDLLEEAAGHDPAVVFLPGYDRTSGFIIRQSRNMGMDATFLGGNAWSYDLYQYGGSAIDGCYHSGLWHLDPQNEIYRAFAAKYKNRFRSKDIHSLALSRDAVFLLADAVGRAGSLDPVAIRDALAATKNFQGATGTITMDQNGDPQKMPVPFFTFKNGNREFLKMVTP